MITFKATQESSFLMHCLQRACFEELHTTHMQFNTTNVAEFHYKCILSWYTLSAFSVSNSDKAK